MFQANRHPFNNVIFERYKVPPFACLYQMNFLPGMVEKITEARNVVDRAAVAVLAVGAQFDLVLVGPVLLFSSSHHHVTVLPKDARFPVAVITRN